jgi:flagellar biosynthesis protein FliR
MELTLEQFLVSQLFAFLLIFARVGAGVMIIPGIGEAYVPPRMRLLLALLVSLAMTPALQSFMPPIPASALALTILLTKEAIIGIFIAYTARLLVSAMHTAGMIISYQSSLSAATMFDTAQATQGSGIGNFLGLMAVVLVFSMDLHHPIFVALFDSYQVFTPAAALPVADFSDYISRLVGDVFILAVQLSAPIIVVGVILYLGAGILSRLMPNMQVFFVLIPPQILICFVVLMLVLSSMMMWYLEVFEDKVMGLVPR